MRETISWPPQDPSRRGSAFMGIVALAVLITIVTFAYSAAAGRRTADRPVVVPAAPPGTAQAVPPGWAPGEQVAVEATPSGARTGLRLIVADPPAILNTDTGRRSPVSGLPDGRQRVYDVITVGNATVMVGTRACLDCVPSGEAFALRDGATVSLGPAWSVAPSLDEQAVWVLRYAAKRRCVLREVNLDGSVRRADQPIDCRVRLRKETPAGLLVDFAADRNGSRGSALLDPATGAALGRYPGIDAITRNFTLTQVGGTVSGGAAPPWATGETARGAKAAHLGGFVLTDLHSGNRLPLPWPSELGRMSESIAGGGGRYLAAAFADPAGAGGRQPVDVWVLDTVARRWQQMPGMPTYTALGRTSMAWTLDGRLVILGSFGGLGDAVAVWRPGDERVAVRRVSLPDHRSTASFTVLPPASRTN